MPFVHEMTFEAFCRGRWFQPTPGRFVLLLLAVEVLLWLSERFGWLHWHKGYAVLTGVAVVVVAMLGMAVWLVVALVSRWRFQFSIRSLLVLVVVVAVPCSWLATDMKRTKDQSLLVAKIRGSYGLVEYVWQLDANGNGLPNAQPPGPKWLRQVLGDDFFGDIAVARLNPYSSHETGNAAFTDADLKCVRYWTKLRDLSISCRATITFPVRRQLEFRAD